MLVTLLPIIFAMTSVATGLDTVLTGVPSNWTTCEEFLNNTNFDKNILLNINWVNIYSWSPSPKHYKMTYKFNIPYNLLTERFRMILQHVVKGIQWKNATFFLESSVNFSALLFCTNKPGLFRAIPSNLIKYKVFNKKIFYAMKLVRSKYLAIMDCENRICELVAPDFERPDDDEVCEVVKNTGFYNGFVDYPCMFDEKGVRVKPRVINGLPRRPPKVESEIFKDEDIEIEALAEDSVMYK